MWKTPLNWYENNVRFLHKFEVKTKCKVGIKDSSFLIFDTYSNKLTEIKILSE